MGDDGLNWSWFDQLQWWEYVYDLWVEGELKSNLTHHNDIKHSGSKE